MTGVLRPYNVDSFNSIPTLAEARDIFRAKDGLAFFDKIFVPLVKKYDLEDKMGLGLDHRHFGLEDGEKLVEVHNISWPWKTDGSEGPPNIDDRIIPASWLILDDQFMPYEFKLASLTGQAAFIDLTEPNTRAFCDEFKQAVKEADLDGCLGLRLTPEGDFDGTMEIQQGRANLNLKKGEVIVLPTPGPLENSTMFVMRNLLIKFVPSLQYDPKDAEEAAEVMWFSCSKGPSPYVAKCLCYSWIPAGTHFGSHTYVPDTGNPPPKKPDPNN